MEKIKDVHTKPNLKPDLIRILRHMHDIRISEQVFKELIEIAELYPLKKFLCVIIETSSYLMQKSEFISDKVVC